MGRPPTLKEGVLTALRLPALLLQEAKFHANNRKWSFSRWTRFAIKNQCKQDEKLPPQ